MDVRSHAQNSPRKASPSNKGYISAKKSVFTLVFSLEMTGYCSVFQKVYEMFLLFSSFIPSCVFVSHVSVTGKPKEREDREMLRYV